MRILPLAAAFLAVISTLGGAHSSQTIRRHFTPADRESGRYQYVPFDVAGDVTELTIRLRYDDGGGASVIDLGLIEPGPLALGATALRGYSGGATRAVTIGIDRATPGYLPGPILAGRWHVLLGLYRVAPAGVDVEVDVETGSATSVPSLTSVPSVRRAVTEVRRGTEVGPATEVGRGTEVPAGPQWFSGGLHLHTIHSDGTIAPNALASAARNAGLDFIAITDHNNTTHRLEPADSASPLRIVGEEITTPGGHANAWGLRADALVDFRVSPRDPQAAAAIRDLFATAHRAGAVVGINHPVGDCAGCAWEQALPDELDAIEIWNGRKGPQEGALALWDRMLRAGKHVTAVGASDWHRGPDPIDAAAVRVFAPALTERDVLSAIRSGRVVVMRNAREMPPAVTARCGAQQAGIGDSLACAKDDAARLEATAPAGERIDLIWNGQRVSSELGHSARFTLPSGSGYARVHVYAPDGEAIAITNPVYVSRR